MVLPLIFGLMGSGLAGAGALGGMSALTAGAIGSGLGGAAQSGSLKDGIMTGIGSYFGGSLLGAAGGNLAGGGIPGLGAGAANAATTATTGAATNAATNAAAGGAAGGAAQGVANQALQGATGLTAGQTGADLAARQAMTLGERQLAAQATGPNGIAGLTAKQAARTTPLLNPASPSLQGMNPRLQGGITALTQPDVLGSALTNAAMIQPKPYEPNRRKVKIDNRKPSTQYNHRPSNYRGGVDDEFNYNFGRNYVNGNPSGFAAGGVVSPAAAAPAQVMPSTQYNQIPDNYDSNVSGEFDYGFGQNFDDGTAIGALPSLAGQRSGLDALLNIVPPQGTNRGSRGLSGRDIAKLRNTDKNLGGGYNGNRIFGGENGEGTGETGGRGGRGSGGSGPSGEASGNAGRGEGGVYAEGGMVSRKGYHDGGPVSQFRDGQSPMGRIPDQNMQSGLGSINRDNGLQNAVPDSGINSIPNGMAPTQGAIPPQPMQVRDVAAAPQPMQVRDTNQQAPYSDSAMRGGDQQEGRARELGRGTFGDQNQTRNDGKGAGVTVPATAPATSAFSDNFQQTGYAEGGAVSPSGPQGGSQDEILIANAVKAIKGSSSNPEQDLGVFVAEFGEEALNDLITRVQAGEFDGQGGNQVSDGRYIQGAGDGVSDSIEADVDGKEPTSLSSGEFVIPSDVVSGLGNGSSDAGGQALHDMMARIRSVKGGVPEQPKKLDQGSVLPA